MAGTSLSWEVVGCSAAEVHYARTIPRGVASGRLCWGRTACDFHDVLVEVTYTDHDKSVRRQCHTTEVGNVVEEFCRDFPQASVYYDREAESGYIAEVRCHCPQEKALGCCRNGHHHRAKVHVSIVETQVSSVKLMAPGEATQKVAFGG